MAAWSRSSEYCTSSHSLWRALSGSFSVTGIDTRERSLPGDRERVGGGGGGGGGGERGRKRDRERERQGKGGRLRDREGE